jgi:tetratricopeptide (TPR) repeat protein
MLKPKKKITRQDLKEDKLVKTTLQVKTYLEENNKQVLYFVLGVFAIVLIIMWYRYSSQKTSQEAEAQLGMAQIEFNNANYERAANRLRNLIQQYKGTGEAKQGLFLLANIYYQYEDYKQAREYFKEFVDTYSGSDILLASGYAGLAACYENEKNFTEAGRLYEKAAKIAREFVESDNYFYLAGICYKKAGDLPKAKQQFETLVNESKSGKRSKDAETQLMLLQ